MKSWWRVAIIGLMFLSSCEAETTTTSDVSKLSVIKNRGQLVCGVSGKLPGFSFVNEKGEYSGIDVDVCKAISAALFDDPDKVEYRNLSSQQRFTAVQTGEVDILSRNTSWTMSRDTTLGLEFGPVVFYDGQGMMVKANSGITTIKELEGKAICVKAGTTTEQTLADEMRKQRVSYTSVVFDDEDGMYNAYQEGRCQAVTSDTSQLFARRSILPNPTEHLLLDILISKEPLAPALAKGDTNWLDGVRWVVYAMIQAEELGITSQNVATLQNSSDPNIRRFLGLEGNLGEDAGLPNDFALRIVKHVGNYGEVYERNIGKPFGLKRGKNDLWNKGGLLYAPPFR